jgi:tRNA threonylcarbamoyladenosine biosynthesis protein TsaE
MKKARQVGPALPGQSRVTDSPAQTRDVARRLVEALPPCAVIALYGDLGSGKTCFTQGLAQALGVERLVTSPTFVVVNEYSGRRRLYHMDLYRMRDPDEILALGFADYLEPDGITAIEWAERAGDLIPASAVRVFLSAGSAARRRTIRIVGAPPLPD